MIPKKNVFVVLLLLCATATSFAQSTVYFYRLKSLYMANTSCKVTVNDTLQFIVNNGGYREVKTTGESLKIKTSPANQGIQDLKLEKGKTYYIEVKPKGLNSVELVLSSEYSAKPAIERLQADEKVQETSKENLKTMKVTSVESLPKPEEGVSKIYIFRPYNITGVSMMVKVAAEDSLFIFKNFSSHTYSTTSGEITLRTINDQVNTSNSSLNLKLEKGKVYYVAVLRSGGAIVLTDAKEGYAKTEMKLQ